MTFADNLLISLCGIGGQHDPDRPLRDILCPPLSDPLPGGGSLHHGVARDPRHPPDAAPSRPLARPLSGGRARVAASRGAGGSGGRLFSEVHALHAEEKGRGVRRQQRVPRRPSPQECMDAFSTRIDVAPLGSGGSAPCVLKDRGSRFEVVTPAGVSLYPEAAPGWRIAGG